MADPTSPSLTREKLAFFGAISASLSHELKNVLATINEFAGLIDDLAQVSAGGIVSPDKLRTTCGKVNLQIKRGEELIGRLNRFAHSADLGGKSVEINGLIGDICSLCNRFATLKRLTLKPQLPEQSLVLTMDPFALQHAVYLGIDLALAAADPQGTVTVALDLDGASATITIDGPTAWDPQAGSPETWQVLGQLMTQLGGCLEWRGNSPAGTIALGLKG